MKRILRLVLFGLAALVVVALAYSAVVVVQARRATPALVQQLLDPERMELLVEDFPPGWIDTLLKVEDPAFYQHNGMDLSTPGAGLTTITQGLVKQMYFERFKPGFAKLKQTLIAVFALDALVSKDTQLRLFVNTVYLGHHEDQAVNGFGLAAREFYGKRFQELTEAEYLQLVAMIIGPNTFHVKAQPEANAGRVERIRRVLSGEYRPQGLTDVYYEK